MSNSAVATSHSTAEIVAWAIKIEDEINKQLNPSKFRQTVQATAPKVVVPEEDLPSIQQDEEALDSLVEGVPF